MTNGQKALDIPNGRGGKTGRIMSGSKRKAAEKQGKTGEGLESQEPSKRVSGVRAIGEER